MAGLFCHALARLPSRSGHTGHYTLVEYALSDGSEACRTQLLGARPVLEVLSMAAPSQLPAKSAGHAML